MKSQTDEWTIKVLHKLIFLPVAALLALPAIHVPSNHSTASDVAKVTDDKAQKELMDALEAVKGYSVTQRDQLLEKAKSAVAELDVRINRLESKIDTGAEKATQSTKDQWKETLATLRQQRIAIAEKYGELQQSTETVWDKVKEGFRNAYDEIAEALKEAEEAF